MIVNWLPLRRLARAELGSAAVEFAATATVLLMTLIGVMKVSQAIYTYHYLSEAAREGARFAMVRGSACTGFASACPAASSDIQSYVQSLGYPGINGAALVVNTTWAGYPTGVTCTPSSTCNNPGNMATVRVTYAYPLSIPWLGTQTYNMASTAAIVISQ